MLRKFSMIAAVLLLTLPIGGAVQIALPNCLQGMSLVSPVSQWMLGPRELAITSACLAVLALTVARRREHEAAAFGC